MTLSPPDATEGREGALRMLSLSTTLLLVFATVFRPLQAGQAMDDTGTAFFEVAVLFVLVLWLVEKALAGRASLPAPRMLAGLGAFAASIWIAALTLRPGGDMLQARLLAEHWTLELLLVVILLDHVRTRERFGALLAAALAAGGLLVAFGLYQRAYGLDYFRRVLEATPGISERMVGGDAAMQRLWTTRIGSPRVYGPFGYANAMAGFLILILPVIGLLGRAAIRDIRTRNTGRILLAAAAAGLVVLLFTGSKGGWIAARLVELGALLLLARAAAPGRWRDAAAGWALGTVPVLLPAALVWDDPAWGWAGQTASGLLWSVEILFLHRLVTAPAPPAWAGRLRTAGLAVVLLAGAGGAWFLAGAPGGPEAIRTRTEGFAAATQQGTNTVGVRWNYWRAGVSMFLDRPLLGMGLDQYGTWYTSYKPLQGWAVRRAHSLPVQLAADGGLVLLAGFVAAWGLVLSGRRREDPLPLEPITPDDATPDRPRRQLFWTGLLAVGCAYLLVVSPIFGGLGVELLESELLGGPISRWPVDKGPGLIHLFANGIALPGAAALLFAAGWRAFFRAGGADDAVADGLRLGIAGFLIHGAVDFVYYMQGLSGLCWILAALLVVLSRRIHRQVGPERLHGKPRIAFGVGVAAVLAGVLGVSALSGTPDWVWPLAHWRRSLRVQAAERLYHHGETTRDLLEARALYGEILARTPRDVESHRRAGEICRRLLAIQSRALPDPRGLPPQILRLARESDRDLRTAAVRHARAVAAYHGGFAASHAFLGRTLLAVLPGEPRAVAEARDAFAHAVERNPHRPDYLRWLGYCAEELGETAVAAAHYRTALTLDDNPLLTDARARLDPETRRWLEARLAALAPAESAPPSAPGPTDASTGTTRD